MHTPYRPRRTRFMICGFPIFVKNVLIAATDPMTEKNVVVCLGRIAHWLRGFGSIPVAHRTTMSKDVGRKQGCIWYHRVQHHTTLVRPIYYARQPSDEDPDPLGRAGAVSCSSDTFVSTTPHEMAKFSSNPCVSGKTSPGSFLFSWGTPIIEGALLQDGCRSPS